MSYELKCRFCHEKLENCTCDNKKIRKFSPTENTQAAKLGQSKKVGRVAGLKSNKTSNKTAND